MCRAAESHRSVSVPSSLPRRPQAGSSLPREEVDPRVDTQMWSAVYTEDHLGIKKKGSNLKHYN